MNPTSANTNAVENRAAYLAASVFVVIGILIRLIFLLSLPLLENDSIIIFQAAREMLAGHGFSPTQTLPVLIIATIWSITGESLVAAGLPDFLAGIGTLFLVYRIVCKRSGRTAGMFASALAAAVPISILFDSIAKPYSLVSFFILAGIFAWDAGLSLIRFERIAAALVSGLFFGAAFACHTFTVFAAFPLLGFFLFGLFFRKHRVLAIPSLISGLSFGAVVSALVIWRFPQFGWSIFNDYVADWRFDIARNVWSGRWEGLTNLFALAPFSLIPGLVFYLGMKKERVAWPIGVYLAAAVCLNVLVYLLNPVNHFPRVLLPAVAPMAIFVAIGLAAASRNAGRYWFFAVTVCASGALWLVAETVKGKYLGLGLIHGVIPLGFLLFCIGLTLISIFVASTTRRSPLKRPIESVFFILFLMFAMIFGVIHAHAALDRQVAYYQGRLKALLACGSGSGVLGGGDATHLILPGPFNYSWLTDLPADKLSMVFTNGLSDALRAANVGCVVVAWEDPEGEQAMLAGFAESRGLPFKGNVNVYQILEDSPDVVALYGNDKFSAYKLQWFEPKSFDPSPRRKLYSPLLKLPIWSM